MLQFNLSNGKSYVYETAWNMDQTIMNQPSTVNISGVYGIEVLSEEAGIRTLKGVYRNFKMYMKMMGMEIDVDTDKPNTPVAGDENNPSTMVARVFSGVAGLDMDYLGNPFGQMPFIMAKADYVTKLHAICVQCGNIANYSYRKIPNDDQVMLGATDVYEPRCRICYKK